MAGDMRSLTLADAVALHERLALPLCPATLHPRYVAADAIRNPVLHPVYLGFEMQGECWMHALHLTDVPGTDIRDGSSPYGYGGPLSSTNDPAFLSAAWQAYVHWMLDQHVAVEYVRFHPVLGNEVLYGGHAVHNRQVVCVDLDAGDLVAGYAVRLRQTLKRAVDAGLLYEEYGDGLLAREFAAYHRAAMGEMQADAFYLFDDQYFEQLAATGFAKLAVCRASDAAADAGWLAAALFLDGAGTREYHLAATTDQGRKLGASSFVLAQAALRAREHGLRKLYLGGGTDARPDNPLLFFKSAYSPQRLAYRTGWTVFDHEAYDRLKERFPAQWSAHPERPIFYRKV
jgi:hypothetical protein